METLLVEKKDKITILTFNRPKALNALNAQLLKELSDFLESYQKDATSRVLILTGSGEKSFVAGADINEFTKYDIKSAYEFAKNGQKILSKLEALPQVVIGAINGFALGGGLEIALACDFLVASTNAKLGLPEVTLGLIPGFGGTQRLSRQIGQAKAKQLIYSAQMLTAAEALQWGIVNQVVEQNVLIETVSSIAQKIISNSPLGISHAKKSINYGFDLKLDDGLEIEAREFSTLFGTKDQKEGVSAFLEKRKPQF